MTFGNDYIERPDWPTRLTAATRILGFYEATPIATKSHIVAEVAIEQTTTRRATSGRVEVVGKLELRFEEARALSHPCRIQGGRGGFR